MSRYSQNKNKLKRRFKIDSNRYQKQRFNKSDMVDKFINRKLIFYDYALNRSQLHQDDYPDFSQLISLLPKSKYDLIDYNLYEIIPQNDQLNQVIQQKFNSNNDLVHFGGYKFRNEKDKLKCNLYAFLKFYFQLHLMGLQDFNQKQYFNDFLKQLFLTIQEILMDKRVKCQPELQYNLIDFLVGFINQDLQSIFFLQSDLFLMLCNIIQQKLFTVQYNVINNIKNVFRYNLQLATVLITGSQNSNYYVYEQNQLYVEQKDLQIVIVNIEQNGYIEFYTYIKSSQQVLIDRFIPYLYNTSFVDTIFLPQKISYFQLEETFQKQNIVIDQILQNMLGQQSLCSFDYYICHEFMGVLAVYIINLLRQENNQADLMKDKLFTYIQQERNCNEILKIQQKISKSKLVNGQIQELLTEVILDKNTKQDKQLFILLLTILINIQAQKYGQIEQHPLLIYLNQTNILQQLNEIQEQIKYPPMLKYVTLNGQNQYNEGQLNMGQEQYFFFKLDKYFIYVSSKRQIDSKLANKSKIQNKLLYRGIDQINASSKEFVESFQSSNNNYIFYQVYDNSSQGILEGIFLQLITNCSIKERQEILANIKTKILNQHSIHKNDQIYQYLYNKHYKAKTELIENVTQFFINDILYCILGSLQYTKEHFKDWYHQNKIISFIDYISNQISSNKIRIFKDNPFEHQEDLVNLKSLTFVDFKSQKVFNLSTVQILQENIPRNLPNEEIIKDKKLILNQVDEKAYKYIIMFSSFIDCVTYGMNFIFQQKQHYGERIISEDAINYIIKNKKNVNDILSKIQQFQYDEKLKDFIEKFLKDPNQISQQNHQRDIFLLFLLAYYFDTSKCRKTNKEDMIEQLFYKQDFDTYLALNSLFEDLFKIQAKIYHEQKKYPIQVGNKSDEIVFYFFSDQQIYGFLTKEKMKQEETLVAKNNFEKQNASSQYLLDSSIIKCTEGPTASNSLAKYQINPRNKYDDNNQFSQDSQKYNQNTQQGIITQPFSYNNQYNQQQNDNIMGPQNQNDPYYNNICQASIEINNLNNNQQQQQQYGNYSLNNRQAQNNGIEQQNIRYQPKLCLICRKRKVDIFYPGYEFCQICFAIKIQELV